ncbi:MAG: hypothetical protein OXF61_00445 [Acidimicrobiaceae bacterium]|nr:hypothetical protein [Acidimicrobiaceae bacterium]
MSQLPVDTTTTAAASVSPRRWRRWTMPYRDRRDRLVNYVAMLLAVIADIFVIASTSWWGWSIWAQVLACLPVLCAALAMYAFWYWHRTPAASPQIPSEGSRNAVSGVM